MQDPRFKIHDLCHPPRRRQRHTVHHNEPTSRNRPKTTGPQAIDIARHQGPAVGEVQGAVAFRSGPEYLRLGRPHPRRHRYHILPPRAAAEKTCQSKGAPVQTPRIVGSSVETFSKTCQQGPSQELDGTFIQQIARLSLSLASISHF